MCNYLPPIIIFHYPHRKFQHRYLLENKRVFQVLGIPTIHETRFIQILQTWKTLKCMKWIASCKVHKLKIGVLVYNLLTAIIFLKIFYLTKQSDLETTWALSRFRLSHKMLRHLSEPMSHPRETEGEGQFCHCRLVSFMHLTSFESDRIQIGLNIFLVF